MHNFAVCKVNRYIYLTYMFEIVSFLMSPDFIQLIFIQNDVESTLNEWNLLSLTLFTVPFKVLLYNQFAREPTLLQDCRLDMEH